MGWEGEAGTVDPVRKTDGVGNRSRGSGAFAAERLRALLFRLSWADGRDGGELSDRCTGVIGPGRGGAG
jgi:hypothetical protein